MIFVSGCYFAKHASYSLKFSDRNEGKGQWRVSLRYQVHTHPSVKCSCMASGLEQASTLCYSTSVLDLDPLQSAKTLFVARVLCGRTVAGNSTMTKPPIDSCDPKQRPYNSACDNTTNPSMYVVFDSAQAYPAYVILF